MDIINLAFLAVGILIGTMINFIFTRRGINKYVASILMNDNHEKKLLIDGLRRDFDGCKDEMLQLKEKVIILESKVKTNGKAENGDN